jgi:hypothetical protein
VSDPNVIEQFNQQCFERSAKICEPLDIEAKKPRICGRQIMRDNVEAESPEDYFRKSITVPFLYCTGFLATMSRGSHILALLSKHW